MKKISSTKYIINVKDLEKLGIKGATKIATSRLCHTKTEDIAAYNKGACIPFDSLELTIVEEAEV